MDSEMTEAEAILCRSPMEVTKLDDQTPMFLEYPIWDLADAEVIIENSADDCYGYEADTIRVEEFDWNEHSYSSWTNNSETSSIAYVDAEEKQSSVNLASVSVDDSSELLYSFNSENVEDAVVKVSTPVEYKTEHDLGRKSSSVPRKGNKRSFVNSTGSVANSKNESANSTPNTRTKRKYQRVNKDLLLLCENSEVIAINDDEENYEVKRVTRLDSKKHASAQSAKVKAPMDYSPGRLVWASYRRQWWPAIIIKAEDVGMISSSGKVWIFWLGEFKINQLSEKNIEIFSNDLESRLDNLSLKKKKQVTIEQQKDEILLQIIELLKKNSLSKQPLMKPFAKWITNQVSSQKQKQILDNFHFYPYPKDLMDKLDGYKKQNVEKSKKYLEYLKDLESEKESKATIKKVKLERPIIEGGIEIINQKPGIIVWAKLFSFNWWPCVIVDHEDISQRQPQVAHQWVLWYSDFQVAQVEYTKIISFTAGMELMRSKIKTSKKDLFLNAVVQAATEFCKQSQGFNIRTIKDVKKIFYKPKNRLYLENLNFDQVNSTERYPPMIQDQLQTIRENSVNNTKRKDVIDEFGKIDLVLSGDLSLQSICMRCFKKDGFKEHPFFMAHLCESCWDDLTPQMFAYGNDRKCFFCTLCGGDDRVAMCDEQYCPRVFCTACIKFIICPNLYNDISNKPYWRCFICDPDQLNESCTKNVIKIRRSWQESLQSIYSKNFGETVSFGKQVFNTNNKIRVLSLFDGIGTGLQVLKNLGIKVECYWASEIDENAMAVSHFNHGTEIIQLGDVRHIDEAKIKEIAPIDLLIGGSPCNDLSLVNPKRRGLDDPAGTGILFYEYTRILESLQKHNEDRHLFWLFENVASMPKIYRTKINEELGREPLFLDSADFSAQHRPRLYWGNLPCTVFEKKDVCLQDMLHTKCGRQALTKKIMTITTRTSSLNQTKENLKVVQVGNKQDTLWVSEVEQIFGFPTHYTDANLSATNRLKLLGKAWSVQTLEAIIRSITYFQTPENK